MIRLLLFALIGLLAGVGLVVLIQQNPGFVLIGLGYTTIETSLAFAIILALIGFASGHIALRLLSLSWGFPAQIHLWQTQRLQRQSLKLAEQARLALIEQQWADAEQRMRQAIERLKQLKAPIPASYPLTAAQAAHQLGESARRDRWLQQAQDNEQQQRPRRAIASGIETARYHIQDQQHQQALSLLHQLHSQLPKHPLILRLLAETEQRLGDWRALKPLLPELQKRQVLEPDQLNELSNNTWAGLLEQSNTSLAALKAAWNKLPKAARKQAPVILSYSQQLLDYQQTALALELIENAQSRCWDDALIRLYSHIEGPDPSAQLANAQAWLKQTDAQDHDGQRNPPLLLALGKLARRARLWGKARSYLEAAIGQANSANHNSDSTPNRQQTLALAHAELGDLLLQLNETEHALEHYRQGLSLRLDTPLPPSPQAVVINADAQSPEPATQISPLGIPGIKPQQLPEKTADKPSSHSHGHHGKTNPIHR